MIELYHVVSKTGTPRNTRLHTSMLIVSVAIHIRVAQGGTANGTVQMRNVETTKRFPIGSLPR